eukprot:12084906-Alexandrium_andersonii.AAC.1
MGCSRKKRAPFPAASGRSWPRTPDAPWPSAPARLPQRGPREDGSRTCSGHTSRCVGGCPPPH